MSRLKIGASACLCLAQAWCCGAAVAAAPSSPQTASLSYEPSHAPTVPAAWALILDDAWASDTSTYDLAATDLTTPPTAVYDILARVVVLPDGARLEAHSGLREHADDPRFVAEHMRGATPPALYDLAPRERLFHGVAALRLLPVTGDVFGRTGLLAHTYMLKGRPESNGCVVFRDYGSFLNAFRDGRIKRLRVVPSVGDDAGIDVARAVEPRA